MHATEPPLPQGAPAPVLALSAGSLRLSLRLDLGAAIAGFWCGALPVLVSTEAEALDTAWASGGYLLAPYSNRLGNCQFNWQGQTYRTALNNNVTPHAMHGVVLSRPWQLISAGVDRAELQVRHAGDVDWPFAFTLRQRITLTALALQIELVITNDDTRAQPAGLGWHPYFPKRAHSRLQIQVTERWDSDPATELPTRALAQHGINAEVASLGLDHCFGGWSGVALIDDEQLSLRLSSSLGYLVVYTPHDKPLFAVEPVSHVNNALNMADPTAHGVQALAPGETMTAMFLLEVAHAQPASNLN